MKYVVRSGEIGQISQGKAGKKLIYMLCFNTDLFYKFVFVFNLSEYILLVALN